MQEGYFFPNRLGVIQRAAQAKCLAHRQRRIGKALLAVFMPQHKVGGTGQALMAGRQKIAVIVAMQHATQDIELLGQYCIGFSRIHRWAATALTGGVFLQRTL